MLRSGRWDWRMESAALGSKVVYRRWGSTEEEMVTWIPGYEITDALAEEAGRDPLHRTWMDAVGLAWQLTIEPLNPWRAARESLAPAAEGDSVALVFARGWHKRAAAVPKDTHLGELTQGELARLFEGAGSWM